jgi:hypothetical protein
MVFSFVEQDLRHHGMQQETSSGAAHSSPALPDTLFD